MPGSPSASVGLCGAIALQLEQVDDLAARGQQPAQRVGERESDALPRAVVELVAIGVGGFLQMVQGPEPHLHGGGEGAGAGARAVVADLAHLADPLVELRQEQVVGHGDAELAALHGFGTFVGGFELRVHPLVAEEAGAVLGDAVAAHQADGLAHHARAVAGVPELAGGAEDVGDGVEQRVVHQRRGGRGRRRVQVLAALPASALRIGAAVPDDLLLQRIELVEHAGRFEAEGGAGFAGRPDIHQAVHHVLLQLQAQLVAGRAGRGDGAAAEPPAAHSGSPARRR